VTFAALDPSSAKQTVARRDASSSSSTRAGGGDTSLAAKRSAMKKQLSAPALPRRSVTGDDATSDSALAPFSAGTAKKRRDPTTATAAASSTYVDSTSQQRLPLAEVVFISEEELEDVLAPIEREMTSLQAELERLSQNHSDALGLSSEAERIARIGKITQQVSAFAQRKQSLLTLFNLHYLPSRRRYELDSKDRLLEFIRIGEQKQEASLADIVNRVRVYLPENPLLRYLTVVDTPGWNVDSHAWGEDFRMRRSQILAASVDAWIYLTPAYDMSVPLNEHLSLLRSLVRDNAPGMVVLSCFDNNKDGLQSQSGLQSSLSQRLDAVDRYFEASRMGHSRDVTPLICAKLVADLIDVMHLRTSLHNANQTTGNGNAGGQLKSQLKRRWRGFLDNLNSILSFILRDTSSGGSSWDGYDDAEDGDDDENASSSSSDDANLLNLDEGSAPAQRPPVRIEQFVKLTTTTATATTTSSVGPTTATAQDQIVSDLAAELSGLPHMYLQLRQLLQPTIKKSLSQRYVKLDQHARRVLTAELQGIIRLHHSLRQSIDQSRHAIQLAEQRSTILASIATMERLQHTFKRQCDRQRLRLEQQLHTALELIISTSDLPLMLEHRRKREKRKGFDLFFAHREAISLREVFDAAVRTCCHQLLARCLNNIALVHFKLFNVHDLESPLDYARIPDDEFWLEEAQCITGGWEQPVELRGSKRDPKAVADWLRRALATMHDRKATCVRLALRRFDTWTKRLFSEQADCVDAFITRNKKEVVRIDKELKRSRAAQLDSSQVKSISSKIAKRRSRADQLFHMLVDDIFTACNTYYV
jgi:hypothetical protein